MCCCWLSSEQNDKKCRRGATKVMVLLILVVFFTVYELCFLYVWLLGDVRVNTFQKLYYAV